LNFLGITGLSIIILGIVLLVLLRAYYSGLEVEYLQGAMNLLPPNLLELMKDDSDNAVLQGYMQNAAFLSQTRMRVLDENEEILVDTGPPAGYNLTLGVQAEALTGLDAGEAIAYQPYMILGRGTSNGEERIVWEEVLGSGERVLSMTVPRTTATTRTVGESIFGAYPLSLTSFGFDSGGERAGDEVRSSQERQIEIQEPGGLVGYIEVSEGPAYGREIIRNVSVGFLIAGAFSVLLAGGVGAWVSRRMSDPLTVLADSTARVAEGDYAIRTEVERQDELGALSRGFNHMASMVEKTVASLRRFVSYAAHEINTPLTALRTNLELARGESSKEDSDRYVQGALEQVDRLEGMTKSLLDLSRLESGESGERLVSVDLSEMLREESEAYASRAEQKGVSFTLDLPEEGVEIMGRPSQLCRVVENLLDNAVKFTPQGGRVAVGFKVEGAYVEISVQDTGIGVSEGEIPNLFQRFYRAGNASTYPGSGLGLAIVKSIVDVHGGFVFAESGEPGLRVSVNLPLGR
jgi:two-component system sensor histidine kinase BaeS